MALKHILVVAGNHRQYQDFLHKTGRLAVFHYVNTVEDMRGLRDIHIIYTGTYFDRDDIQQINELAAVYKLTSEFID